jgi:hypothetical protein
MHQAGSLRRVANRAKREMMARVSPVNKMVRRGHDSRLRAHRPNLPSLGATEQRLVDVLEADGVSVTTLDALRPAHLDSVKGALETLMGALADMDSAGKSAVRPSPEQLLADIDLWQAGLDPRLLDLAENYLGLPVRYYGAAVHRQVADGRSLGTRQWHRDIEDHRVFKILVWLADVGPRGGALQYVPKRSSQIGVTHLRYVAGFVSDEALSSVVTPDQWRKATGPQWTAVLADTAQILHRAGVPEERDRYSVTFTWTSRRPIKSMAAAESFTPDQVARIRTGLDARQLACLPLELLSPSA